MIGREMEIVIITNEESIKINKPHIQVNVQKNINPSQNKANVQIWGLERNTRNKLEAKQKIIIKAGYADEGGVQVVYRGEILKADSQKNPPEVITVIEASSGVKNIKNQYVSRSYSEGVYLEDIINDVIDITGYAFTTNLKDIKFKNIQFKNGFSFSGEIRDFLNKVCEVAKLQWNINDDRLKIFNPDFPDIDVFYYLNKNNGMFKTPKAITIKDDKTNKELKGWEVLSKVLPSIEPNSSLGLAFDEIPNGAQFQIRNIEHEMDNREGSFHTKMEAISA